MIALIRQLLLNIIKDIDAGNSNISEQESYEILELLRKYNSKAPISKYQAYTYLNMSRAKFDNLVKEGKLPKGKKVPGFKELQWDLQEINNYIHKENGK